MSSLSALRFVRTPATLAFAFALPGADPDGTQVVSLIEDINHLLALLLRDACRVSNAVRAASCACSMSCPELAAHLVFDIHGTESGIPNPQALASINNILNLLFFTFAFISVSSVVAMFFFKARKDDGDTAFEDYETYSKAMVSVLVRFFTFSDLDGHKMPGPDVVYGGVPFC
eukprot:84050-Rhodomonas_salina.1